MTSAHVHSLLLHCSLVHSLLLLHSLLSALELPYEVHRTNPVKGHNAVMHWCTDALMMHSLTLLWCVVNLWFHRSAILCIMKEFRDLRDFHHFWRHWPAAMVTDFIFQRLRSLLETLTRSYVAYFRIRSRQVNLSVGRSSQLALTSFLIQDKYFANQRYFEAQTRATGWTGYKHFTVIWTKLDWKYLQLCDAEQRAWKVMEFDFNRAHIAMTQSWNM